MASGGQMLNQHFFFSNKFVQLILRFHPDHSQKDQLFSFCAITFYVFPGLVHQFYQLFTSKVLLHSTVSALQKTMGSIGLLSLYSVYFFNFVTMKLLLTDFNNRSEQNFIKEELIFLEENVKQSKLYTYVSIGLLNGYGILVIGPCVVKVCLYFLGILDKNQLSLIAPVNNISFTEVQYFSLLIYQIIVVIVVVTVGGMSLSAYIIIVLYACYQFRVLIFKIRHPFERSSKYIEKDCCFRKLEEEWDWIIDVINKYKETTEYVDLLSDFSKISYLVALFFSLTLIIIDFLYIFQLSIDLINATEIVECCFYIGCTIFTVYVNFYIGQELMNYSDIVFKELCQVPFYILSRKSQKVLLFMIARSCKPSMLSIGDMFVSSHETFSTVIRKAFSFAMVYYNSI